MSTRMILITKLASLSSIAIATAGIAQLPQLQRVETNPTRTRIQQAVDQWTVRPALKLIRPVAANACTIGSANIYEDGRSPKVNGQMTIEIVEGQTALRLIGPRMDRIQRAQFDFNGNPSIEPTIRDRTAPGECNNAYGAGNGAVTLLFGNLSARQLATGKLFLFVRNGRAPNAPRITLPGVDQNCAIRGEVNVPIDCDLMPDAPHAMTIDVKVFPKPAITTVSDDRHTSPNTRVGGRTIFNGSGLSNASIPFDPEISMTAMVADSDTAKGWELVRTFGAAEYGSRVHNFHPELVVQRGANKIAITRQDTAPAGTATYAFQGRDVTFTRTRPQTQPTAPTIRGHDPKNILKKYNGTDADQAGTTYTALTSMQPCAGLSPPPFSAGHVTTQKDYNFPNIRWGVTNSSSTPFTESYTAELREGVGGRVVATFTVNGLGGNETRFAPDFVRPSPTTRVAVFADNQRCLVVGSPSTLVQDEYKITVIGVPAATKVLEAAP